MDTEAKTPEMQRPYWHVDAKWVSALFFMFFFGLTLFTYGLFNLTNEKNGIDTMTKMITLAFSRDGIDSASDIDKVRADLAASSTGTVIPNPALNITLTNKDVIGKSPREIRLSIFRQLATPIYFNGKGAEDVLNTPEARANFEKDTFLLRLFSEKSHIFIGNVLVGLAFISAIFMGLVIFFSFKFGRIGNPGLIILITALPWALVFAILRTLTANFSNTTISFGETAAYGAMIGPFVREILPDVANIFLSGYLLAIYAGIGLLIIALISKITFGFIKSRKSAGE